MKTIFVILAAVSLCSCALIAKDPKSNQQALIYYTQGTKDMLDQNYTDALKNLQKANDLKPNDTETLNNLAMTYYFKGRTALAIKHLRLALDADSKNSDARNNLATIYMNLGKYSHAKKEFNTVINDLVYKKTFRAYYNLGVMSYKQKNISGALRYFKKAIGHRDDYCPAHFQLATIYQSKSLYKKALNHYKKSIQNNCGTNALPYFELAKLYMSMGDKIRAQEYFQVVMQKFPEKPISKRAAKLSKSLNKWNYSKNLAPQKNKDFIDSGNF